MSEGLLAYLALAGVVFGVNLLPAFGPPTWAVLVFFRLNSQLAAVPLVLHAVHVRHGLPGRRGRKQIGKRSGNSGERGMAMPSMRTKSEM